MEFAGFIEQSNGITDPALLFDLFRTAVKPLGYDRIVFSLMTDHAEMGLKAGHGILGNYPDDWMKHYLAEGYFTINPVCCYVFQARRPFLWGELSSFLNLSPKQQAVLDGGAEAGLNSGIGIPLHGPYGELAAIGGASADPYRLEPNAAAMFNAYCHQFFTAYSTLMRQPGLKREEVQISDREREVLMWCAKGKSSWDIGMILGISSHGVDFHLRNVMRKLQTQSRMAAIVKALHLGLIRM